MNLEIQLLSVELIILRCVGESGKRDCYGYLGTNFARRDLVHMGTSAPFNFRILKISKSRISISSKIMASNI
jgi:hypothetical protein